jgi:23S rRNA (adenine1618-N6)-methyltransferase
MTSLFFGSNVTHPKNFFQSKYDFKTLKAACPELLPFIELNPYQIETIDFANAQAVKTLNYALLKTYYQINFWDIPKNYLCPPIPGRADYIHHIAEFLSYKKNLKVLDIGVGANCIYPIIGVHDYGWQFVGSDIDVNAINSAKNIIEKNSHLKNVVELRIQKSQNHFFKDVINQNESFDISICNPPFHASLEEAQNTAQNKWNKLGVKPTDHFNFGGQGSELFCPGGEVEFLKNMIFESAEFGQSVNWFSTLVSKKENLSSVYGRLKQVQAKTIETIQMSQGHKLGRIVMWSFKH